MRRPDVFTLDYSHHLSQGLVLAGLGCAPRGLRYTTNNVLFDSEITPANVFTLGWVERYGRMMLENKRVGTVAADYLSYVSIKHNDLLNMPSSFTLSTFVVPYVISNGTYAGATNAIVNKQKTSWDPGTGRNYGIWHQNYTAFGAVSIGGVYSTIIGNPGAISAENEPYQISMRFDGTEISLYINGIKQDNTVSTTYVDTNTGPFQILKEYSNTVYNFKGLVGDVFIHNRALSPSEIAILADRTDPMLGGLIVDERPVLYFDMGGSSAVEGPAVITAESTVAMLGQKGAVGPATVTASSSVGMGGVKGASAQLNIVGAVSVEASGLKSTSGPATVSAQSSLGMGGIVELFGLDKTGPASFSAASSVGAGGVKASSSPAAITSASALGMGGIKTILGLDKEGPATFAASSSLGMGGAKGAVSQAWIGADSEIVAAGVKAGIGSAAWLAAGGFLAGKGPDVTEITADEVRGRVVLASVTKNVIMSARNRTVMYGA